MKDWLIRALKTFAQAFIASFGANAAMIQSHILQLDWANWKAWLLPVIVAAAASGISAIWNLIIEITENYSSIKEQAMEVEELRKQVADLQAKLKQRNAKATAK